MSLTKRTMNNRSSIGIRGGMSINTIRFIEKGTNWSGVECLPLVNERIPSHWMRRAVKEKKVPSHFAVESHVHIRHGM